ncbi:peptide chain release factor N(5)-glutamine methyltransferase [Rosettibacter firmus]|uniref:peptide chain release factor N(5)-glutamine methyltransferase n=1 Tax=Rosettibacter firmus TaxID=3111522 RepID=UPI00336C29DF
MITVLDSIKLSTEYLEKKGVESPRLNAELLLADILNCKRLDLYLKYDQPLSEDEINKYREYISRRAKREPLQYIIGKVDFFGLELKINKSVLIPRPETEILVETIINREKDKNSLLILDIGTGSGNIAIALAKSLSQSKIVAVDISNEALKVAEENVNKHNVINQIELVRKNILEDTNFYNLKFDIIVSNPPYVSINEYQSLQEEIILYEPQIAVTDNDDGLKFYRKISEIADKNLKTGGRIYLEIGAGRSEQIENILTTTGFSNIQFVKDYQQINRIVYGIKI